MLLFAEKEADFVKAVKKSTVGATLLAVGMFLGVMPGQSYYSITSYVKCDIDFIMFMISFIHTTGHAYVLEGPFNSIVVPTFETKITLPGFRVAFDCPDNGAPATATVR